MAERRNYTNVFNALGRITKEEGVLTLWRVCDVNLYIIIINEVYT